MAEIKGLAAARKRFNDMDKTYNRIAKSAMQEAVGKVWQKAIDHTTAGAPRYLNRDTATLSVNIRGRTIVTSREVVGTVGIPDNVRYGKAWELGFNRKVGKGRRQRKWQKPRPWLSGAYKAKKAYIRKRFERITQDLLKAAK